ncbi:MAG: TatD family hydrolase [Bacteroidales bacterium]|nr:TatD family hydrolase [Bacteroidales bacterium]
MMVDFHTHNLGASDALISVSPCDFAPSAGRRYSVGIHPWHTEGGDVEAQWTALETAAADHRVVAIGETGLDSLKGAPMDVQLRLLKRHIALAEAVGKPLVIHMVRTSQQVLKAWRESRKSVAWAIHGFRGNERVVAPLVEAGFYISFGERFNAEALKAVPLDRMLAETDESELPIGQIVENMAAVLQMPVSRLETVLEANLARFLRKD